MSARALTFVAPRRVEVRPVERPSPGPDEMLVEAELSGISGGTEMLAYRGEIDPRLPLDETIGALGGTFAYPFRYGYALVGRALDGARVFAFAPHQDVVAVPRRDAVAVGDLDARVATMYPLVETAVQVAHDAAPRLGERAVVLGLGPVGVLTAASLQRAGAVVTGAEPRVSRRKVATSFGVHAVAPDELEPRAADLVVECSGAPGALAQALDLLVHEGSAVVCSWYGTKPVALPLGGAFHRRRLTIRSTQVSTIPGALSARWDRARRRALALELLRDLPMHLLATHTVPFERAADAYAMLDRGDDDVMHVALSYA